MTVELLVARHGRVDAVKLPEVDALEAQTTQAEEHLLAQIVGPAARHPERSGRADEASLGGDEEA